MSIYSAVKIYDPELQSHLDFDRAGYLERCVRDKSALHVGCTDWPVTEQRIQDGTLLHSRLLAVAREVIGIDLSEMGIAALRARGYANIEVMDAEKMDFTRQFDVILAGDVLEHMNNPGIFLEKAKTLIDQQGEIIIGVPSALTINNIKTWLLGREQVHSDHTFYFSPKTLAALLGRYGLLPVKLVFTVQPGESGESRLFLLIRRILLKAVKVMAPSIIMHFKKAAAVDTTRYFEWK